MMRFIFLMPFLLSACIPAGDSEKFGGGPFDNDDVAIVDSGNLPHDAGDSGNTATQPDAAADQGPRADLSEDTGECVPEGTAAVCAKIGVECGTARGEDNCSQTRDVYCGSCVFGTGCASGVCIETECRDGMDNNGNDKTDCADPDCANQRCSTSDQTKRCQDDGSCQ